MSCQLSSDRQTVPGRQTFWERARDLLPKTMRFSTLGVCLVLATQVFLISGCVNLGPDYQKPEVTVEADWLLSQDPPLTTEPLGDPRWWQTAFKDDDLNRLVEIALKQNLTLRSAGLRVLQSQQQLAIAIGNQFPQVQQLNGGLSREKSTGVTFDNYNLGFNLSWEADFWGRFRRQVESASAELDVSVANFDGAVLSMVSQVAQNYILIRTFQDRIRVARNSIKNQEESVRITQAKFDAGEVSELDKDQAESLLYNTRATVPALETSLQQFKNSLAILLGLPPQNFNYLFDTNLGIPSVPADIALGMPQDLIRRRPDVRTAERQLAAQSAQIGFAETELYPQFSIGGSIGTSSQESNDLFKNASETWDLFGMFEWNIFNYGRLQSNVRLQDALFQQLLVDYQNTVLQAQGDVENAIVAYLKGHEQLLAYKSAADASRRAVNIATIQYQEGAVGFNTVINTLSADVQQQDLLSSNLGNVANNLVEVYKALGGGWEIREGKDPVDLLPSSMKDEMLERTKAWEGVLNKPL